MQSIASSLNEAKETYRLLLIACKIIHPRFKTFQTDANGTSEARQYIYCKLHMRITYLWMILNYFGSVANVLDDITETKAMNR